MVLEVSARPGLAIQIANPCGLCTRLDAVERARDRLAGVEERVAFALRELARAPER